MLGLQKRVGILKLGTTWPLPPKLLEKHLRKTKKILIVEEVMPFLEENVKVLASGMVSRIGVKTFFGKYDETLPAAGELNPDIVADALGKILKVKRKALPADYLRDVQKAAALIPAREQTFCAGCPHRASFWNIHQRHRTRRPRGICLRRHRLLFDGGALARDRLSHHAHAAFHGVRNGTGERLCQVGSIRSG